METAAGVHASGRVEMRMRLRAPCFGLNPKKKRHISELWKRGGRGQIQKHLNPKTQNTTPCFGGLDFGVETSWTHAKSFVDPTASER